jgi:hypothetical protein
VDPRIVLDARPGKSGAPGGTNPPTTIEGGVDALGQMDQRSADRALHGRHIAAFALGAGFAWLAYFCTLHQPDMDGEVIVE